MYFAISAHTSTLQVPRCVSFALGNVSPNVHTTLIPSPTKTHPYSNIGHIRPRLLSWIWFLSTMTARRLTFCF